MKKVPRTYTEEELLKALEEVTPDSIELEKVNNDVLAFISFFNIIPGPNKVSKTDVYSLYLKWSKDSLNKKPFAFEMNRHFENKEQYYLINLSVINVKNQLFELIKNNKPYCGKITNPKYQKHFKKFLIDNNIIKGTHFIEAFVLFFLYDKWHYNNTKTKNLLGREIFNKFFQQSFETKKYKNEIYYAVDISVLNNFTEESLSRIRQGYHEKKDKAKETKTEKQKKRGKVFSSETGIES